MTAVDPGDTYEMQADEPTWTHSQLYGDQPIIGGQATRVDTPDVLSKRLSERFAWAVAEGGEVIPQRGVDTARVGQRTQVSQYSRGDGHGG